MESQNGNLVHSRSKAACSNVVEGFGVNWQGTLKSRIQEHMAIRACFPGLSDPDGETRLGDPTRICDLVLLKVKVSTYKV